MEQYQEMPPPVPLETPGGINAGRHVDGCRNRRMMRTPLFANRIIFGTAADMAEVPDGSIALIVTSPPYFCIKAYGPPETGNPAATEPRDYGAITDYAEYLASLETVWTECRRVLKPNGKLAINAPLMPLPRELSDTHHNRDILNIYADIEQSVKSLPDIYLLDLYIWNRTNSVKSLIFGSYPRPGNIYAQNTSEFIGIFVKAGKPPPTETYPAERGKLSQKEWLTYTRQIWDLPIPKPDDAGMHEHPALMPAEMAERLIRLFTRPGEVVLDPFAGSGTTLMAAQQLGRKWIGYEIHPHYAQTLYDKITSGTMPKTT